MIAQYIENNRFSEIQQAITTADPQAISAIYLTILDLGSQPPMPLVEPTINYINRSGIDCNPLALSALSGVRTKEAITPIVGLLAIEGAPERLVNEAAAALLAQTGREDLGTDPQAWVSWWEEARWLPPREWEAMQAVAHAERARRLQRETDQQASRILELHRQMYGLTPQDQRSALLATMMGDPERGVRSLAFELAERALLNTQRLDEQVREAAVERLEDPIASIRAAAASLLFRLGSGPETTAAVRRAIRREADPAAAAAMLDFLRRRPDETDLMICLDWLGDQEPAASAAARTLASSAGSGALNRPMIRNLAMDSIRILPEDRLTPGKIELWGILGGVEDRARLATLLEPGSPPAIRRAAANAIVRWPESVEVLASACAQEAFCFPMLADAITLHEPTAEGFARLSSIQGVDPEIRSQRLLRLRRAMSPSALLGTIGPDESHAAVIESVLFDPDHRDLLRRDPRLLLTQALARARYGEANDQGVIELLGLVDPAASGMLDESTARYERRSLICLGRFDEADASGADEADWREAADRSERLAFETAPSILLQVAERFPDPQSPADGDPTAAGRNADRTPAPSENSGSGEGMIQEILTLEPSGGASGADGGGR